MRKGVVIKLYNGRATLMAEDCMFCEIKAFKGMYKGMEVCFSDMDVLKRKVAFRGNKYLSAACFMLMIFCSYLFLSFYQENIAAYAYVGIDINPSIEITLNKKGKIIRTRGLDEEGKELLEGIDIRQMDSIEGVKQIISKTINMNYLAKGGSNEITVYAVMEKEDSKNGNELLQQMEKVIKEEVVAHNVNGEVKTIVSDKKIKNKADKIGVSVAQYISQDMQTAASKDNKVKAVKENKEDNKKQQGKKDDEDNKEDKIDKNKDVKNKKDENKNNANEENKGKEGNGKQEKGNKKSKNTNENKGNNKKEQDNKPNNQKKDKDKNNGKPEK